MVLHHRCLRFFAAPAFLALLSAFADTHAGDITAGKATARTCMACHGLDGISRLPDAPHLAGDSAIYLTAQLRAYRSGERKHPQMSVIAASLTDEDIANLAAWYSAIAVTVELPE